jgi:hypothetical protein
MPMKILMQVPGGFAMIGIGDIIIPGLLVSMCLRYDFIRGMLNQKKEKYKSKEDLIK